MAGQTKFIKQFTVGELGAFGWFVSLLTHNLQYRDKVSGLFSTWNRAVLLSGNQSGHTLLSRQQPKVSWTQHSAQSRFGRRRKKHRRPRPAGLGQVWARKAPRSLASSLAHRDQPCRPMAPPAPHCAFPCPRVTQHTQCRSAWLSFPSGKFQKPCSEN